jgi:hypothetical protein
LVISIGRSQLVNRSPNHQPKPPNREIAELINLQRLLLIFLASLLASLLVVTAFAAAPAPSRTLTLTGIVSDNMCAQTGHAAMRMGPTDAECTVACVDVHGALYVLVSGREVYTFSDQQLPQKFAGRKVRARGTVENVNGEKIFRVDSITEIK